MRLTLILLLITNFCLGQSQRISDMPSAVTLTGSELVPVVQSINKKATVSLLRGWGTIGTVGQSLRVNSSGTGLEFYTPGVGSITGTGTTNELTYWTGTTSLGSLTTATYPSLTELSYVKGLTSSAQTQLNNRWNSASGATLTADNTISGAFNVDFTNTNTRFNSGNLQFWNPAKTFKYTFTSAAWTADRTITIPTITAAGSMMINAAPTISRIPYYIDANWLTTNAGFTFNGTTFTTPNITSNGVGSFFNGVNSGEIRIYEPSGSGTNYNAFTTAAQAANITYTLPTTSPSANGQVLISTTSGVMSWSDKNEFVNSDGDGILNVKHYVKALPQFNASVSGETSLILSSEIDNGESATIVVHVTGKADASNIGFGGMYVTSWTKASGVLNSVGSVSTNIVTDTGTVTVTSADVGGNININLSNTSPTANHSWSWIAYITIRKT